MLSTQICIPVGCSGVSGKCESSYKKNHNLKWRIRLLMNIIKKTTCTPVGPCYNCYVETQFLVLYFFNRSRSWIVFHTPCVWVFFFFFNNCKTFLAEPPHVHTYSWCSPFSQCVEVESVKGTVHPKTKIHMFPFIRSAIYPSRYCLGVLGDIVSRDVCSLLNIIKLHDTCTSHVPKKLHLKNSTAVWTGYSR